MPRHPRPARTCPAARLGQCLKSRRYRSPDKELTCGLRPTPAHLLAPGCGVRRGSGTSPRARRKSGWSHVPDTAPQHSYEQSSCLNSLFPGTVLDTKQMQHLPGGNFQNHFCNHKKVWERSWSISGSGHVDRTQGFAQGEGETLGRRAALAVGGVHHRPGYVRSDILPCDVQAGQVKGGLRTGSEVYSLMHSAQDPRSLVWKREGDRSHRCAPRGSSH